MTASKSENSTTLVQDLASHRAPFVKIDDLARYWSVSRRQVQKQIAQGKLPAVRLGPRSFRIATEDAIEFERSSIFDPSESLSSRGVSAWQGVRANDRYSKLRDDLAAATIKPAAATMEARVTAIKPADSASDQLTFARKHPGFIRPATQALRQRR